MIKTKTVSPRTSKSLITTSSTTLHEALVKEDINSTTESSGNQTPSTIIFPSDRYPHTLYSNKLPKSHEVFIGNLRPDESTLYLITSLQDLFKSVGVVVANFQFTLYHRKGVKARKYAFVLLGSEWEEEQLYSLNETEGYEFIIPGLKLIVSKRLSLHLQESVNKKITYDGPQHLLYRESKSETSILQGNKTVFDGNNSQKETSTRVDDKNYRRFLYYGQHLPTEDRVTEYKRGSGNYIRTILIAHIRKYVCAFLNSEGGRLMIGVDDKCKVCGISCTRKQEDRARCQIDNTIKFFQPHVQPNMYMIDFIPVKLSQHDHIELESMDPLLKVLEVCVHKQNVNMLYVNDHEKVFIRRDGSVEGPLKPSQVVEWCRVNFTNRMQYETISETKAARKEGKIVKKDYPEFGMINATTIPNQHQQQDFRKFARENRESLQDLQNALLFSQRIVVEEIYRLRTELRETNKQINHLNKQNNETAQKWRFNMFCNIL